MSLSTIRPTLVSAHRWVGLVLAPVFLLVILSGAVLSFRPIVAGLATDAPGATVSAPALTPLVTALDARSKVTAIAIADQGRAVDVTAADPTVAGRWDIASGARVGDVPGGVDVFGLAERLHKQLLVGLGLLVEIASWAMVAIVVTGPFLTWLRFRNTLIGWHMGVGWLLFPLALMAPLTGVLMSLHVGEGGTPLPRAARPVTVAQALTIAAPDVDLSAFVGARAFRGGTVMLTTRAAEPATFVVTDTRAVRLTSGPSWVKQIHEGLWGGVWSGLLNFVASMALLALTVTGVWSWYARRRRERPAKLADTLDVLVAHASQTGTATRYAEATAEALRAGGETVAVAPLGTLEASDMRRARLLLVVASTTGEGEIPDGARRFVTALAPDALAGVRYAVLGLGDRSYAQFCGGAERLRVALKAAGAEECLPPARADRDPGPTWTAWMRDLDLRLGVKVGGTTVPVEGPVLALRLAERRRLDDPSAGDTQETWAIGLTSATPLDFRPGDLLRIAPEPGARERSYSIGSSSRTDPHRIDLTVKLHLWSDADGRQGTGLVSEHLTRSWPIGREISARLTAHPGFNPPDDPRRPILLIASGTGIAPFPGFLAERKASGRAGPAWLVFGNRHANGDYLYRETFETALAQGTLSRLDTAFSRDANGMRVPARLDGLAETVRRWLTESDALVYVCGRRALVDGVLEALATALAGAAGTDRAAAEAEIARRVADGRIRIDAFD